MDQIEFEDPELTTCNCCGRKTTRLTRFVTRDGDAFAVYYVEFTDGHGDAFVRVGMGEWGDEVVPEEGRDAFNYHIWLGETSYKISLIEPDQSPWSTNFLGRPLSISQALAHPLIQEVWDLSDHMVRCDEPVVAFLDQSERSALTHPR